MDRVACVLRSAARSRFRCEPSNRSSRNPLTALKREAGSAPWCAAGHAPPRDLWLHFSPHRGFSRRKLSLGWRWPRRRPLPRHQRPRNRWRIPTKSPQLISPQPNQLRPLRPSRSRLRFRSLVLSRDRPQSPRPRRLAFPTGPPTRSLPRRISCGTATGCSSKPPTRAWTGF